MKTKQRLKITESLRPYIRELADKMALRDWDIVLSDNLARKGSYAECCLIDGKKRALIYLGETFFDQSPEDRRHTLVHELTHCHFGRMHNGLCDALNKQAFPLCLEVFEDGIESISSIAALSMPLPPQE